jgi:hypothetical protein
VVEVDGQWRDPVLQQRRSRASEPGQRVDVQNKGRRRPSVAGDRGTISGRRACDVTELLEVAPVTASAWPR